MDVRWSVRPADPERARTLARASGIHPLIAQLLLHRGIGSPGEVRRFLNPGLSNLRDPSELPDLERSTVRLRRALAKREPIFLFGDSDVDGISASAILYEALRDLGACVTVRLSNRLADGYGFPGRLIGWLRRLGIRVAVLVDCGTNQAQEVAALAQAGIDTIIVDHHLGLDGLATPLALVNPHLARSPAVCCSSAGLALKIAEALFDGRRERLARCLDLACLGTLADCAPLVGDNRHIVHEGLSRILHSERPGLRRLCDLVGVSRADPEPIVRRLIPRLNAAGRLGDAAPVWELLTDPSEARRDDHLEVAGRAHAAVKELRKRIFQEAAEQVNRLHFKDQYVMVVGRAGWHPGVMGSLAAQLLERYARPTIAIAMEERLGVGSGRSPSAFNLFEALQACQDLLMRFGGHPQACGLALSPGKLEPFREQINRHAHTRLGREDLVPTRWIDLELPIAALAPAWVAELERLAPFGVGNPRPTVLIRDLFVDVLSPRKAWLVDKRTRLAARGTWDGVVRDERYDVIVSPSLVEGTVELAMASARLSTVPSSRAP